MQISDDRVVIAGGGVVGLCIAHFLERAGCTVTVLERAKVGSGASWGNAGEISPELAMPLPAPGMVREATRSLFDKDGALYIKPSLSPGLLRFLAGFTKNSSKGNFNRGRRALNNFAKDSRELFSELDTVGSIVGKEGYLYAYPSETSARSALADKLASGAPVPTGLLSQKELLTIEPALNAKAVAGFLVEDQWWIDPVRFVEGLANDLRSRGVEIIEGVRVTSIEESAAEVVVRTTTGDVGARAVVLAAGIETRDLCRRLGVRINVFPGKGYSFSVPADPEPRRPICVGDAHVVLTPMPGRVRVAGTMELDNQYDALRPNRIAAIAAAASPYFSSVDWASRSNEWVGTRVLTPDGLPAIGRVPGKERVLVATGHNMLGLMLAPATGRLVTEMVTDPSSHGVAEFNPRRLCRSVRTR